MSIKIDVFNHIFPKPFFERLQAVTVNKGAIKRWLHIPFLHDLDVRFRMLEEFGARLPAGPVAVGAADRSDQPGSPDHARSRGARQRLAGGARPEVSEPLSRVHRVAAAQLSGGERRASSSAQSPQLGALGVQVFSNVNGLPLDDERFFPLFETADRLRVPDSAAPGARRRVRRLSRRSEVEVRDLVDLRLALRDERGDAAAGVLAAVRSPAGYPDRRASPRRDGPVLRGTRRLRARPVRRADRRRGLRGAAQVDAEAAVRLLQDVLGGHRGVRQPRGDRMRIEVLRRRIRWCSRRTRRSIPKGGPLYIRETIRVIDSLEITAEARRKIYQGNAERLFNRAF